MSTSDDRRQRWLAYHLGELNETERRAVEAELAALGPGADAQEAILAEAVRSWATEPVEYEPADPQAIAAAARASVVPFTERRRPQRRALWWIGGMAAAALVVLALSPLQFGFQLGPVSVAWNMPADNAPSGTEAELASLKQQVEALAQASQQTRLELAAAQQRNAALESWVQQTAATLAENQKAESLARYRDVQELARIVSASGAYTAVASSNPYGSR